MRPCTVELKCSLLIVMSLLLFGCSKPGQMPSIVMQAEVDVPAEYCAIPASPPSSDGSLSDFSEYAWRLFVAANWPVETGNRGQADCRAAFGSGTPVWESYKTTDELFLAGAADPGPWQTSDDGIKTLKMNAKADSSLPLSAAIMQAVGGWLIDRERNPTYYEIAFDQTSYNYVTTNRFYNQDILNAANRVRIPDGAIEVKAAWRILTAGDNPSRFYSRDARVMQFDDEGKPTDVYKNATVGLVGFHLIYKAPGFPQWIWTTFEQVDNVKAGSGESPSYHNPFCSGDYCAENASPIQNDIPFGVPNRLTRLTPIHDDVASVNARWQAQLYGTPFVFYELVSPQWPADPLNPGNPQGSPTPDVSANLTLESYIQPESSCMDCHSTARTPNSRIKTDNSFIFLFAQKPDAEE